MKTKQIDKQLATYSTAAGAVLLGAAGANAGVIYTAADIAGGEFAGGEEHTYVNIDLDGNGSNEIGFEWIYNGWDGFNTNRLSASGGNGSIALDGGGYSAGLLRLGADATISAALAWSSYQKVAFQCNTSVTDTARPAGFIDGPFSDVNTGYIGVKFYKDDGYKYGWVHIDSIASDGKSYHIDGYAYEDSGSPITTAVPEPSSLALLALGAAGIRSIRRFNRPGA